MASVKLVSVNIEGDRHFERLLPFLKEAAPDVLCVQELREPDIPKMLEIVGPEYIYSPTVRRRLDGYKANIGEGIFTRYTIMSRIQQYYVGTAEQEVPHEREVGKGRNLVLTGVDIDADGTRYRFLTTHFTWTADGMPNDEQRSNLAALQKLLDGQGDFILTGDYNAPRGTEIFTMLAGKYRDNIPAEYDWSLDLSVHRHAENIRRDAAATGLRGYMVDGLFTTPAYNAHDVKLVAGVSDHCAVVATVSRAM